MKNQIQYLISSIVMLLCLGNFSIAQFNPVPVAGNFYGETDATGSSSGWIRKIGIGNFSSNTDEPHAFLDVNSRYLLLPGNGSITGTGEVFHTDCPTGTGTVDVSAWRMLRNGTQVFNISNPYGYSDIHLGTVESGDLFLFTAGNSKTRVTIMGHDNLGTNTGYVGIGTSQPESALMINGGGLPDHTGEVFRTDIPYETPSGKLRSTYWRLFNSGLERGRIFTYGEDDNAAFFYPYTDPNPNSPFYIQSSHSGDQGPYNDIRFNTPSPDNPGNGFDATPRMRILGGEHGYVGIGDFRTFVPQNLLHLHIPTLAGDNTTHDVYEQFTNDNTTATDDAKGFKIGITYNSGSSKSDAELISQQTGANMNFKTNATPRMTIVAGGNVGIGDYSSFVPQSQLSQWASSTTNIYHQFTNGNTGNTNSGNGFKIGITNSGSYMNAELLSQQNGADMNFYTSAGSVTNRMQIRSNGNVGIGVTGTSAKVEISNAVVSNTIGLKLTNTTSGSSTGIDAVTTGGYGSFTTGISSSVTGAGSSYIKGLYMPISDVSTGSNIKGIYLTEPTNKASLNWGGYFQIGALLASTYTATNTGLFNSIVSSSGSTSDYNVGNDININYGEHSRGINCHVDNAYSASYAGFFHSEGTLTQPSSSIGVYAQAQSSTGFNCAFDGVSIGRGPEAFGALITATGGSSRNFGVSTSATGGADAIGMNTLGTGGSSSNTGIRAGAVTMPFVFADANIGGNFRATDGNTFTYGIVAGFDLTCTTTDPVTGLADCPDAAGFFFGDVAATGVFRPSDSILKTNVNSFNNALSIIDQLQPKSYLYDTAKFNFMHLRGDLQYGFIAQDLIPILPQCLKHLGAPAQLDSVGNVIHPELKYLGVNLEMMIPILVAGMKEQQQQIADLQQQINNCCNAPRPAGTQGNDPQKMGSINVKLSNSSDYVLYQNIPNPYSSATVIKYFIPEGTVNVKMVFMDETGKMLKEVPITETGMGSVKVDGRELISGTYTYSLVIQEKIVETKKMVKVK